MFNGGLIFPYNLTLKFITMDVKKMPCIQIWLTYEEAMQLKEIRDTSYNLDLDERLKQAVKRPSSSMLRECNYYNDNVSFEPL